MVILASASPRRRELMALVTENFRVMPADCDETVDDGLSASETVEYLSLIKGNALKGKVAAEDIIISADTVVAVDGEILGKPCDKEDARRMIKLLSGRTHSVYTGVTLTQGEKQYTFSEKTDVEFFKLSDEEIEDYISTAEPYDKAGAYGIQGKAALLVKGINGDYYNVVGFPVARLRRELNEFVK